LRDSQLDLQGKCRFWSKQSIKARSSQCNVQSVCVCVCVCKRSFMFHVVNNASRMKFSQVKSSQASQKRLKHTSIDCSMAYCYAALLKSRNYINYSAPEQSAKTFPRRVECRQQKIINFTHKQQHNKEMDVPQTTARVRDARARVGTEKNVQHHNNNNNKVVSFSGSSSSSRLMKTKKP